MNGGQLLEAVGYVDSRYVQEAEAAPVFHRRFAFSAIAACLCLILGMGWLHGQRNLQTSGAADEIDKPVLDDNGIVLIEDNENCMVFRVETLTKEGFLGTWLTPEGEPVEDGTWTVILTTLRDGGNTPSDAAGEGDTLTVEVISRNDETRTLTGTIFSAGEERSQP